MTSTFPTSFDSQESLLGWAETAVAPSDEGEYEQLSIGLEAAPLDWLTRALVGTEATTAGRELISEAVALHLQKAMSFENHPPIFTNEACAQAIAKILPEAPEVRKLLPQFVIQALDSLPIR